MSCRRRSARAASATMTRRCAARDRLVAAGTGAPARDSRVRCQGQARRCFTAQRQNRGRSRSSQELSFPGPCRCGTWHSRIGHRRNSLHCFLPRSWRAHHHQHDRAWSTVKASPPSKTEMSRIRSTGRKPPPLAEVGQLAWIPSLPLLNSPFLALKTKELPRACSAPFGTAVATL